MYVCVSTSNQNQKLIEFLSSFIGEYAHTFINKFEISQAFKIARMDVSKSFFKLFELLVNIMLNLDKILLFFVSTPKQN